MTRWIRRWWAGCDRRTRRLNAARRKRLFADQGVLEAVKQCLEDDGRLHWCCREKIRDLLRETDPNWIAAGEAVKVAEESIDG